MNDNELESSVQLLAPPATAAAEQPSVLDAIVDESARPSTPNLDKIAAAEKPKPKSLRDLTEAVIKIEPAIEPDWFAVWLQEGPSLRSRDASRLQGCYRLRCKECGAMEPGLTDACRKDNQLEPVMVRVDW